MVKSANRFYNKLNSGLDITLTIDSKVVSCEDDPSIPKHQFTFTPIDAVIGLPKNVNVDLVGIIFHV